MEENNGSGSNKHQNEVLEASNSSKQDNSDIEGTSTIDDQNEHLHAIIADEIPLNRAKIVGHASLTSSSSSSCLLDVDYDEKDAVDVSSSSEENGSREDAESSADTSSSSPQWSMVSESPVHGPAINQESSLSPEISPRNPGLNEVNTSPMQSPVVQVMGRTGSYDPNRIPLSTFTQKSANSTDWTATSNESLFSLHNGKSGELNKADFSSGLPTVIETTSEIDQKSVSTIGEGGEKENLEIESEPIVSVNDDGNGVNPASPVVEDTSSTKSDSKTTPPPPPTPPAPEGTTGATPKTGGRRCFNCFSCCASRG